MKLYVQSLLGWVVFLFFFTSCQTNKKDINKDPLFTKAVVIEIFTDLKFGNSLSITYKVNGKEFARVVNIASDTDFKSGDTVNIKYQKSDPSNCEIIHFSDDK
jgi:hypothetical protein